MSPILVKVLWTIGVLIGAIVGVKVIDLTMPTLGAEIMGLLKVLVGLVALIILVLVWWPVIAGVG
jgi:hypothetical protein